MQIFAVTLHPPASGWLASARHHDRRMLLVEQAVDAVAGAGDPTLIAMPAGLFRATNTEARDQLANEMASLSKRAQVALVFGIDVAPDQKWAPLESPPEGYAYACDDGNRLLWPARQMRRGRDGRPKEQRCVTLAGHRVAIVISSEIFQVPIRFLIERSKPKLILSLAHARITERWRPALASWGQVAPIIVVDQGPAAELAIEKGAIAPVVPAGWRHTVAAQTDEITLHSYRPDPPVGVHPPTVGDPVPGMED